MLCCQREFAAKQAETGAGETAARTGVSKENCKGAYGTKEKLGYDAVNKKNTERQPNLLYIAEQKATTFFETQIKVVAGTIRLLNSGYK